MEPILINESKLKTLRKRSEDNKDLKFVVAPGEISKIQSESLAEFFGLKIGDKIHKINDKVFRDFFDFQFEIDGLENFDLEIERDGNIFVIKIQKNPEEDLGIEFRTPLFNGVQECANDCPFCFVENQPLDKTRENLQYRDDDFRMSYLHGSYITMTNLSYSDRKRIEELKPGPLYISVHATDTTRRNLLLGRKSSKPIIEELLWLDSLGIPVHTQIVLCPGLNDGKYLIQTLDDLFKLKNKPVKSVAIVPVGLTKYHRRGLRRLTLDEAFETIDLVEKWSEQKSRFAFLSDEFYLMTYSPIPESKHYKGYPQLEDGVGITRLFLDDLNKALKKNYKFDQKQSQTVTWVNGSIAANIVNKAAEAINAKFPNYHLDAICLESKFWGSTNVAGLLTGDDIYQGLKNKKLGQKILIPKIMLKDEEDIFLDDMPLKSLEDKLGLPCIKTWGPEAIIKELIGINNPCYL